jgi:Cu(I)/Ag(I) efflux system membrane fusion protein
MRKIFAGAILFAVLAAGFLAGSWVTWRATGQSARPAGRKVLYWVDPMHPSYKSDKPGIAPDCGMKLEPVYADEAPPESGAAMPANALRVSSERQQIIGVQVAPAEAASGSRTIRTVGRVALDENRIYRVLSATDGIVRRLFPIASGDFVAADQMLLDYYVSEALGAQQSFFYALTTLDRLKANGGDLTQQATLVNAQVRQAVEGLRALGMDDIQIARLAKTRALVSEVEVRSPVAGYVLARNVSPQQRFERATELYRIADLSRVWIEANVFEGDAPLVHAGAPASFTAAYAGGGAIHTRVSQVLPLFDPATRTLKIRLETENPGFVLRPDMFVDVELVVDVPRAVTVPAEAVIDSGSRKTVFVDRGNGYFEPRRIETGTRFGGRVQVVKGLMEGERIVVSGNFLLNSESRLKMTAMGISDPETDPVCGMDVDRTKAATAGRVSTYEGTTFYFCSDDCRNKFEAAPRNYSGEAVTTRQAASAPARPAASATPQPSVRSGAPGVFGQRRDVLQELGIEPVDAPVRTATIFETDPVCGAQVDRTDPKVLKSAYAGRTYYFLMNECKAEFDKDPAKFADGAKTQAGGEAQRTSSSMPAMDHDHRVESAAGASNTPPAPRQATQAMATDPVCGMGVSVKEAIAARLTREHNGRTYYFCSEDCKKQFDADPGKYVRK